MEGLKYERLGAWRNNAADLRRVRVKWAEDEEGGSEGGFYRPCYLV